MTEIRFYHLQSTPLERALQSLLERVLERDWRAVVITGSPERVDALNGQLGARSNNTGMFSLCCELFDGNDAAAVTAARERWKEYQEAGSKLTYWQQTPAGSWEMKVEKNV